MSGRTMWLLICGAALAVTALPNNREPAAAAGDDVSYATVADAPKDVTPAADEPMTVCEDGTCYAIVGRPVRSVVRSRTVYRTPIVYSAPVVYSQPVAYRSRYTYRVGVRQPVFRSNERFMMRGPARRGVAAVGRGVYRVATAPIRWLRCR